MKRIRTILLTAFCFATLAAAQKIVTQYDCGMDFTRFHSYKWSNLNKHYQNLEKSIAKLLKDFPRSPKK